MKHPALNGWQRLWVVSAFLYGVLVVSVMADSFPTKSSVDRLWALQVLDAFAEDMGRALGGHYSPADVRAIKDFKGMSDENVAKSLTSSAAMLDTSTPEKKDLAGYKETIGTLESEHQKKISHLWKEQLESVGSIIAAWLLPSFIVLVLGYMAAWVYSGFRAPSTS